ncbi:MAG: hypothetical protein ACRC9X_03245 [Bacteroidales bacterium]
MKNSFLRQISMFFVVILFFATTTHGNDDLYFNPKRQKEIDLEQAQKRAHLDSLLQIQRQTIKASSNTLQERFDSSDYRGYRGIYDISDREGVSNNENSHNEPESYVARLRYDDPTYIILDRTPPIYGYGYSPWGYYYPHGGMIGWGYGSAWGWNAGWNWGWNMGWGYPYAWGWNHSHHHWWGQHHHYHPHRSTAAVYRSSNVSGTHRGSGYTNNRIHASSLSTNNSRPQSSIGVETSTSNRRQSYESIQRGRNTADFNSGMRNQGFGGSSNSSFYNGGGSGRRPSSGR